MTFEEKKSEFEIIQKALVPITNALESNWEQKISVIKSAIESDLITQEMTAEIILRVFEIGESAGKKELKGKIANL